MLYIVFENVFCEDLTEFFMHIELMRPLASLVVPMEYGKHNKKFYNFKI